MHFAVGLRVAIVFVFAGVLVVETGAGDDSVAVDFFAFLALGTVDVVLLAVAAMVGDWPGFRTPPWCEQAPLPALVEVVPSLHCGIAMPSAAWIVMLTDVVEMRV